MELIELKVNTRKSTGKRAASSDRRNNKIPAVLYGQGNKTVLLSIDLKDFENVLKNGRIGRMLLNLNIQNGEVDNRSAMIKEIQSHPVSHKFIHVDFYEIKMESKVKVKVPVITKGKSKGVELGGLLQVVWRELEVLSLPMEIPESIVIDVTDLGIGDTIRLKNIQLPKGVEFSTKGNFTVISVVGVKAEAVAVPSEEVAAEETEEKSA